MIKKEEVYKIGRIGKPHGVKGELSFHFDDDVFDRVDADYLILDMEDILVHFFMDEYRFRSDETALMKFTGINTEEQARELTGHDVYFLRALADDTDGTPSTAQLIGFNIIDADNGKVLGKLEAIDNSTINILFEIETPDGQEILLPATGDLVKAIDTNSQTITMHIPEGLPGL